MVATRQALSRSSGANGGLIGMRRFILIDHSLIDYSGHHYEYARAVLNAAAEAGYQPLLLANRRFHGEHQEAWPIVPAYKYGVWLHQGPRWQTPLYACLAAARRLSGRFASGNDVYCQDAPTKRCGVAVGGWLRSQRSRRFVRDTRRALSHLKLTRADVVLTPTISFEEFDELRRRWPLLGPACGGRWHFVFRRDVPSEFSDECPRFRDAFGRSPALDGEHRWRLWTDSEELTARYCEATGRRFGTLPVPHARFSPATSRGDGPFRILYLGDARREKGFHHLPALVKALNDLKPRRFAFSIQAHATSPSPERETIEARDELRRLSELGVTLFNRPLDPAEYRQLLGSGHLSLLPYDRSAYGSRSSGVFAESLAAGIPTIVPADTWMSRRQPATAGLTYRSLGEIPFKVNEIEGRFHQYKEVADRHAKVWSRRHGAQELLLQLGCAAG